MDEGLAITDETASVTFSSEAVPPKSPFIVFNTATLREALFGARFAGIRQPITGL